MSVQEPTMSYRRTLLSKQASSPPKLKHLTNKSGTVSQFLPVAVRSESVARQNKRDIRPCLFKKAKMQAAVLTNKFSQRARSVPSNTTNAAGPSHYLWTPNSSSFVGRKAALVTVSTAAVQEASRAPADTVASGSQTELDNPESSTIEVIGYCLDSCHREIDLHECRV